MSFPEGITCFISFCIRLSFKLIFRKQYMAPTLHFLFPLPHITYILHFSFHVFFFIYQILGLYLGGAILEHSGNSRKYLGKVERKRHVFDGFHLSLFPTISLLPVHYEMSSHCHLHLPQRYSVFFIPENHRVKIDRLKYLNI